MALSMTGRAFVLRSELSVFCY